jgi:hypothetical protein
MDITPTEDQKALQQLRALLAKLQRQAAEALRRGGR